VLIKSRDGNKLDLMLNLIGLDGAGLGARSEQIRIRGEWKE